MLRDQGEGGAIPPLASTGRSPDGSKKTVYAHIPPTLGDKVRDIVRPNSETFYREHDIGVTPR